VKAAEVIIRNKYLNQDLHHLKNRLKPHEALNPDQAAKLKGVLQVEIQEDRLRYNLYTNILLK